MRFAKGRILTYSRSKEAATGLRPAIKVISIAKVWWKWLQKNATWQICLYNLFGSDDDSRAYCTIDTKKKKYCFAWDVFSSYNNLGYLKQKVFLKRTWAWLHLCFYDIFLLVLWRKGLVQMFVVFWLVFAKLWSLKAFFESDTTPTNTQHISPLVFFAYFC